MGENMNERQEKTVNWIGRIITWVLPLAVVIYQAGALGNKVDGIDKRVTALELVTSTAQTNAYKLSRMESSLDTVTQKRADDHDTLVRIDQTVQTIMQAVADLKAQLQKQADKSR